MIIKATALQAALKTQSATPLCLVEGEEDELRARAVSVLTGWVLGEEADATFNCDVFYADEQDASTILSCAQEIPVFAPRRLVIVKRAEKIPAGESEAWLRYLAEPNTSTTLLFVASKLDKRFKLSQILKSRALIVDCGPLPVPAVSGWIREEAKILGVKVNEEGVRLLGESAGQSLAVVRRELEKLALMIPTGETAGRTEVAAARGVEPGASVFDLMAAIGARDRRKVLAILARNLEAGEAPLRILGALLWQYRRLWKMMAQGAMDGQVARTLGIEPFKARGMSGRFSEPHFRRAFDLFLDSDSKLKGGSSAGAGRRVLETVLLQLCE